MGLLDHDEIDRRLGDLSGWRHETPALVREFAFADFAGSIAFVNRLAAVAERMNHHPDLAISWNRVTVSIHSHRSGGVTEACLALAAEADRVASTA